MRCALDLTFKKAGLCWRIDEKGDYKCRESLSENALKAAFPNQKLIRVDILEQPLPKREEDPFDPTENQPILPLSWSRLSNHPENYKSGKIYMDGWLSNTRTLEGSVVLLYENKEDLEYKRKLSSVKLVGAAVEKASKTQLKTGQFVVCEGDIEAYPLNAYEDQLGILNVKTIRILEPGRIEKAKFE